MARELRRAHACILTTGSTPASVRPVISESWRRSISAGVDPHLPAPRMLDAHTTAARLVSHPLAAVIPQIATLLRDALEASRHFVAVSDGDGVLLWSDGPLRALRLAAAPRFLPGFLCSEAAVGTNAIGTALAVDHPIQIYSAEHFNEMLHSWVCAAAPVHDPRTGQILGAIDVSGWFRDGHPHSLGLVTVAAKAAEHALAIAVHQADEQLRRTYLQRWDAGGRAYTGVVTADGRVVHADPAGWLGSDLAPVSGSERWSHTDGTPLIATPVEAGFLITRTGDARPRQQRVRARVLGYGAGEISLSGCRLRLSQRHAEIVALLALRAQGMTVCDLGLALYGEPGHETTVRAEMTRLRRLLGEQLIASRPYRLETALQVDVAVVARKLARGQLAAARRVYTGPLLPASSAPGIVAARESLARALTATRHAGFPGEPGVDEQPLLPFG